MSPQLSPEAVVSPVAQPTPTLKASVKKSAAKSFNHFFGTVSGSAARYSDVGSFAWYLPGGGFRTMNTGRKGIQRTVHGLEDSRDVTR